MLKLNVDKLRARVSDCDGIRTAGELHSAHEILTAKLVTSLGEICDVHLDDGRTVACEVVGFDGGTSQLLPFVETSGLRPGLPVTSRGRSLRVPIGPSLLGRVLDGLGRPVDGGPQLSTRCWHESTVVAPRAVDRPRIDRPLETGVRVLDGLLTCGRGQRIGLFAGSGVGKSTLLGEIAKTARADMNVIALVGERGREVRPFLEDCLGETGRDRSVVVLATSEEPPLMRVRAVLTAVAIAASFRDQGHDVMFLLDSVTRMAMAQREIGLLRGEPPGTRGYTPSVFNLLASTLEKLGTSPSGSITGLITVLVDGDDMDEPVSDAVRGILDGHLILNRKLAARGHFPAVDVLRSVSRLFQEIADPSHREAARRVRECLATYEEMEDLIQIGAYKRGTTARIDRAIQLYPEILKFLKQASNAPSPWDQTRAELIRLGQAWGE